MGDYRCPLKRLAYAQMVTPSQASQVCGGREKEEAKAVEKQTSCSTVANGKTTMWL